MANILTRRPARGFTLIELLVVMVIMAIIMSIAVGAYIDWGRGAAMRTSVINVQSSLSLARQWAITHRVPTRWTCMNTDEGRRGSYIIESMSNGVARALDATNSLANGITFVVTNAIQFKLDGSCDATVGDWNMMRAEIVFADLNRGAGKEIRTTSTVFRLTGSAKVERD